ncbi:acyl CoA:acetate/3-ketoacid CoA transferase [Peribacillus sp. NPDC058002]|uniref:acyl CoA:acetate/3-ketoacid CoA transferase n=1 Tax=Peribacillus sp. NPDC058002 TaxID=3346301 RepID=UPI0036DD4291
MVKLIDVEDAAFFLKDHHTLWIGGSGGGHAVPEALIISLEERFNKTESPKSLTVIHAVGIGDWKETGVNRLAKSKLVKRSICGTLSNSPKMANMAINGEIEAYTLPQGVLSQLTREMAAGRPGLITHVGLHTFIDPRIGGGRQGTKRGPDLINLIEIEGQEWLHYKNFDIDVAFIRATTADEKGNLTMENEAVFGENLSIAQATKRSGGIVIAQVERLAQNGTISGKDVKVPSIFVDYLIVDKEPWQTYTTKFDASYAGLIKKPIKDIPKIQLDVRKVIARRAAMELFPNAVVNLGFGIANGISSVAAEEEIYKDVTFTVEQGIIGGVPALGNDAGAGVNFDAILDQPYQFDFYDGGGLDLAFISFAEVDHTGNVNVSKFGERIVGPGGFINITQNSKKVFFLGTLTVGDFKAKIANGELSIIQEGIKCKFVKDVEQITWSGSFALKRNQKACYITERAVFDLTTEGIILREIAPGINIEKDILQQIDFPIIVPTNVKYMDSRIFSPDIMRLKQELKKKK